MPPLPRLIVITDWTLGRERLLRAVEASCAAGPEVAIQHRHPDATARDFLDEAYALAELTSRRGNALFVNGRLDVALLAGAHLHLPARAVRPQDARPHLRDRWISAAVHDEREAEDAEGADLALVSPVFAPLSKPLHAPAPLGADGFSSLASHLRCPAYALGGITAQNVSPLGAKGAAVISSVLRAEDPRGAAERLLLALR